MSFENSFPFFSVYRTASCSDKKCFHLDPKKIAKATHDIHHLFMFITVLLKSPHEIYKLGNKPRNMFKHLF